MKPQAINMIKDLKLDINVLVTRSNLSSLLDSEELSELGHQVVDTFNADRQSRYEWEVRNEKALKLAMQVVEKKNYPWPDAANVKFPLLTIAAMQYHSRAYPALVNGPKPVACRVMAPVPMAAEFPPPPPQQVQQLAQQAQVPGGAGRRDEPAQPGGEANPQAQQAQQMMQQYQQEVERIKGEAQKAQSQYNVAKKRSQRVSEHMSYQILEEDVRWEEEMDKLLLIKAIAGCAFKKTYFDPVAGVNRSECVSPRELVVSYFTKSMEGCPRATHIIPLFGNDVHERQVRMVFNEYEEGTPDTPGPSLLAEMNLGADDSAGIHPPFQDAAAPIDFLEQHCLLDLDGDGYAEPYIVTVRYDTAQVMRIVARYTSSSVHLTDDGSRITRIEPIEFFTKYSFIPSPDGGFYDIGFGSLLGPINHSIDTALNQLLDAGSLSNAGGGFLGRGFKGRKGDLRFKLGEWKTTDSTGDDLHKSIYPLPVREPSSVLFNLLGLLIQYGQQVAGATDTMQGQAPGQNTPAETSRNTLEQGMKVFNGIYKRAHRALTQELRKLYRLNQIFLDSDGTFFTGKGEGSRKIFQADYSGKEGVIRPAADPFYMSDSQRLAQATAVLQAAHSSPGYNLYIANKNYLEALKVEGVDELLPDPKGPNAVPPPPNPKMQVEQLHAQAKQLDGQVKIKIKQMELAADAEKVQAEIQLLKAEAEKTLAEAKGVDMGHQIALINAQIAAKKNQQEATLQTLKILQDIAKGIDDGEQKRVAAA